MILPEGLKPGDEIRIVSPSSEILSFPRRLNRSLEECRKKGYNPTLGKHTRKKNGREAGNPEERAADILDAFTDKNVKAIIASTGGYTSNRLLELLDFNLIGNNPKLFIGSSDITALLLGIHAKTGLTTYHGPNLLGSFGDVNGIHEYTWNALLNAIDKEKLNCSDFPIFSESNLFWDKEDDVPRTYQQSKGLLKFGTGVRKGPLLGGNLETLISILGTEYMPNLDGAILFLEECNSSVAKTLRDFKTLEYTGVFEAINGLVFGRQYRYSDELPPYDLETALSHIHVKFNFPILYNVPFGHTEPKYTFPIGVSSTLDLNIGELIIRVK